MGIFLTGRRNLLCLSIKTDQIQLNLSNTGSAVSILISTHSLDTLLLHLMIKENQCFCCFLSFIRYFPEFSYPFFSKFIGSSPNFSPVIFRSLNDKRFRETQKTVKQKLNLISEMSLTPSLLDCFVSCTLNYI